MTTATVVTAPFAFTLFNWIRTNKKAIYSSLPPLDGSQTRHQSATERYRTLRDGLASFESRYRGEKKWFAGTALSGFTSGFARRNALSVLLQVLDSQAILQGSPDREFNALWQSFLALPGLDTESFSHLAVQHIGYDRLPALVVDVPNVSADFQFEHKLELIFKNGEASWTVSKRYPLPNIRNRTLGEQITALNQYWVSIRNDALIELKFVKNWPTDSVCNDLERRMVTELTEQFFKGLTKKNQELVRKHPDAVRAVLNKHL